MSENESLRVSVEQLSSQNSQYRVFYQQLTRMKSDLSSKKENEVTKLTECLEKLSNYNNTHLHY